MYLRAGVPMSRADALAESIAHCADLMTRNGHLQNQNAALVAALEVLTEHAEETYPHFECERGQREIAEARAALALARGEA